MGGRPAGARRARPSPVLLPVFPGPGAGGSRLSLGLSVESYPLTQVPHPIPLSPISESTPASLPPTSTPLFPAALRRWTQDTGGRIFLLSPIKCPLAVPSTSQCFHSTASSLLPFPNSRGPPCHSYPLSFCQSSEAGTINADSTDFVMQIHANICKSACKGGLPLWF